MDKKEMKNKIKEFEKKYLVNDVINEKTRVVFLLESPHVQELLYGFPVSGSSGGTMTKQLFDEKYENNPLGRLVGENLKENKGDQSLDKIGLMNVLQVPMQKAAYGEEIKTKENEEFFVLLEEVRTKNEKVTFKDQRINDLQEVLVEGIRKKLETLKEKELTIVPCGKFAQKFFNLTGVTSEKWTIIEGVPHPSYNSWARQKYEKEIKKIKDSF